MNKIDGIEYAVKVIKYKKKGSYHHSHLLTRLGVSHFGQALNEVQALASLSALDENPFIVRYFNVWMEEDLLYLVVSDTGSPCVTKS